MFAAETLRLHGAKLMELSRKEFAPSERGGSVAGVHHASSCAIWQSEKETILFVTYDIEEAIQLADLVLVTSPRPATIPGSGGCRCSARDLA